MPNSEPSRDSVPPHAASAATLSRSADRRQPASIALQDAAAAPRRAVVLLSGGLDSSTVAAIAKAEGYEILALSFNYGQRHSRELRAAADIAAALEIAEHIVLDLDLARWGGSSLTAPEMEVPMQGSGADASRPIPFGAASAGPDALAERRAAAEGAPSAQRGYANSAIPNTYVPGRNTVFIAVALSLAEARGAEAIFLGINAVDYSGYPDCRPEYLDAFRHLAKLSSKAGLEGSAPRLEAPLMALGKVEILERARALGLPIHLTWSCYAGGDRPCGQCDSCRIRDAALAEAGMVESATSR